MHLFKKIFLTGFFIIAIQIVFAQTIVSYELSLSCMYLPGGDGRNEIYSLINNERSHKAEEIQGEKFKNTSKKLVSDAHIENTILQMDSLFGLTVFTFRINPALIDTIKAENARNRYYKIPEADIDRFFSRGDTVRLDLKDIKPDSLEMTVIDGCPYFFKFEADRSKDTTIRSFQGNFFDQVQTDNIKNWLPVYLAYRQHTFFTTMPMKEYFTDENLKYVLIRFIEWTNNE